MLDLAVEVLDGIFADIFTSQTKAKIGNYLDRRNVERTISRCAEAPAQSIESYFVNENIGEEKAKLVLDEVRKAIKTSHIDARMLAESSLNAEKLTGIILSKYPIPKNVRDEGLEYPFQMALQISSDSLCNVGVRFAEWEKEAWRRTYDSLDKLLQNQDEILRIVGPAGEGSADERFARIYRSHLLRGLARIDASTFRVSSSLFLDLSTVFVQSDVVAARGKSQSEKTSKNEQFASLEEARRQILRFDDNSHEKSRTPAEKFILKNRKSCIVGLPGSGKSTLLQHVLLSTAKGKLTFGDSNSPIPILLKAKELHPDDLPGPDDLLVVGVGAGKVVSGVRPGFVRRQLQSGNLLLLLDGLDEVVTSKRETVLEWLSDLIEMFPKCRYVVTSRPAGYQSSWFKRLGFGEATLCEFSPEQIREYVRRWTMAVEMSEGATPDQAEKVSVRYATSLVTKAEKNPYVRRIAANPLLLSTLCLVQRYEGGDLPNRRVVLYARCVEGLLFHWDNKRGLPKAILGSLTLERKLMLLRRLALEMQVRGIAECEESFVGHSFTKSLREIGVRVPVKPILENIRDRSGMLVERRPGVYGFSHLTFQEYFTALAINQRDVGKYDRLFLFSKRKDPQWFEVISLYAGIASKDSTESLLRELTRCGDDSAMLLAGECLVGAQDVASQLQVDVVKGLVALPDDIEQKSIISQVAAILQSADREITFKVALASLKSTQNIHGTRCFYDLRDSRCIGPLFDASSRVIAGQQAAGKWDYGLGYVIMSFRSPKAAKALGELGDAALKLRVNLDRSGPLSAFWVEVGSVIPHREGEETFPGVLGYLDDKESWAEKESLCKFIIAASLPKVIDSVILRIKDDKPNGVHFPWFGPNGSERIERALQRMTTAVGVGPEVNSKSKEALSSFQSAIKQINAQTGRTAKSG